MTDIKDFKRDLRYMTELVNKACGGKEKKAETRKMERCEQHVEDQGKSKESAGKICAVSLGLNKTQMDIQHYTSVLNKIEYTPEQKQKHKKNMERWWMIENGKDPDEEEQRKLERDIGAIRRNDEEGMKTSNELQHDTHRRTLEENRYKEKNASLEDIQHYKNAISKKNKVEKPKVVTLESGVKITRATPKPGQSTLEGNIVPEKQKEEEEKPKEKFKQTTL